MSYVYIILKRCRESGDISVQGTRLKLSTVHDLQTFSQHGNHSMG